MHKWINKFGLGGTLVLPGPLSSTGYFNPIKNPSNRKKRFVKNPHLPSIFGQNKNLKLCQNNVVINTWMIIAGSSFMPFSSRQKPAGLIS